LCFLPSPPPAECDSDRGRRGHLRPQRSPLAGSTATDFSGSRADHFLVGREKAYPFAGGFFLDPQSAATGLAGGHGAVAPAGVQGANFPIYIRPGSKAFALPIGASASGKAQVADDKSVKAQKVSDVGDRGFRHGVVERRGHRYAHVWRDRREPA
jgi:hypothetical protein